MVEMLTLRKSTRGSSLDKSLVDSLEALPNGIYRIYITEVGYVTTAQQRKLFWMWMTYLENWSGSTKIEWHDYFVNKYLSPEKHGISDISTKAMAQFLNQIEAEAVREWNVLLPLPKDREVYNQFVMEYKDR